MFRRQHSTQPGGDRDHDRAATPNGSSQHQPADVHNHDDPEDHDHGHSHSIFSTHSHSHDNGYRRGIVQAVQGQRDRGSQITLLGLVINVGLTASKGVAGWYMHSASLLADAGHSGSDLLGDFVTLFCWRLSRKPPSAKYPYGFGKFETIGTTTVSLLLIGGALGIGFHSYHLLLNHLVETASTLPAGTAQNVIQNVTDAAQNVSGIAASVGLDHAHEHTLDPNAAWYAGVSVLLKEWLYRITKKVADDEKSSVLLANAIHHRSDAYTSVVTLAAILGAWYFPALPLDPLGGLLVSVVILQQGFSLLAGAFGELTDAGVSPKTLKSLKRILEPLVVSSSSPQAEKDLLAIHDLRAMRSGALMFVDLTAHISDRLGIREASTLEEKIRTTLTDARKEIYEVRIKFQPTEPGHGNSR